MTDERWKFLMSQDGIDQELTESEISEGWHWCYEFDFLLVGPKSDELRFCHCLEKSHPVYKTIPDELPPQTAIEL